ncbi:neuroligin 4-like [Rhipicephalus sanguineus]|uniref:neuroligin 4-like n=1 Tax=Rhipicephalus sanguineus TaxID=34632 RepID=UPI001892DDBF|nr:neuroligin 4-like [Rhipicephalus sanguineus]
MSLPPAEHSCPLPEKPLAEGNVMVETKGGRLVGSTVVVEGVTLARFLGIPFAQSTAGDRRFAAPLPLPVPEDKCAVIEYLEPGPLCAQWYNSSVLGSEDCLHVNVWTPATALGDNDHGGGRALVVAVSGKWFESGSNNDPDWPMLAAKGDVVVVAPNHRQGVLGFLHPSSVVGVDKDVGVNDVVSAVHWARDNAKAFGADPKQLVVVGRGSGAYLLSAAVRNMSSNSVQRAFYHGIVYGSLLPFDPVVPYRNLAVALHCNGTDKSMSAWVACFRAAPVGELLQAAQASSNLPLQFAPRIDIGVLLSPPVSMPPTVVAGADAADDRELFNERIRPIAQREGNASTPEALLEFTLNVYNAPLLVKSNLKRRFKAESVDNIVRGFSMAVSTCATLKVAKAVAEGYHYRFDSAVATGQLMSPLGIGQVALFAAHGTVPPLADNSPWPPLGKLAETRVIGADGQENFTSYAAACVV